MAKQSSIITMTGTIGPLSFYNTKDGPRVRQKGGVSKERIGTDPKYARTRENNREFGSASHMAKLLKKALRKSLFRAADSSFHSRFVSILSEALKKDPSNARGERVVTPANLDLLAGFRLNKARSLDSALNCFYETHRTADGIAFNLEDCCPEDFRGPANATHFRLFAQGIALDPIEELYDRTSTQTDYLPMELSPVDLSFELSFDHETFPHRLFVLGIEFFKVVAGKPYVVAKRKYNTAEIV